MSEPRRGKWRVEYDFGAGHFMREVPDNQLMDTIADRYGIVNEVTYIGPEVEETNRIADQWTEK